MQVNFLRDLVGPLPFRPVMLSPSVRMWKSSTVVRLAQAIYQGLPLLSPMASLRRSSLRLILQRSPASD